MTDLELPSNVDLTFECRLRVGLSRNDIPVSVVVRPDKNEIERVAKLLSEFNYSRTTPACPVYDEDKKVVCLSRTYAPCAASRRV